MKVFCVQDSKSDGKGERMTASELLQRYGSITYVPLLESNKFVKLNLTLEDREIVITVAGEDKK